MSKSAQLNPIKLVHGALDEAEGSTTGIILRGVIAPDSLHHLLKDDYQREAQPLTSQWRILDALQKGEPLPDIELGMRGQNFTTREDNFFLKDHVYIVDGLQRVTSAIHFLGTNPGSPVRLGATVHFNTTKEWERKRFHILNTHRLKVSPNVLLRNMREESPAILSLYGLSTNDKAFVLHDRVSWTQRMTKGELLTALTFCKVVGLLHSHKVAGKSNSIEELVPALGKAVEVFGIQAVRENIRVFFNLIDECWGIKSVQYREGAIYMRGMFLYVFARLLADHHDFWQGDDEKRLFVMADLKRKIAQFPIHDPEVVRLSGSGGMARIMLYTLMRDHINSGKRTKRLTPRNSEAMMVVEEDDEDTKAA
ncbi:MAG TPA: hypothetical protein VMU13_02805 [Candidatus Paceibacterota bacterium]|nr:hypothetical protein [Candidatus Paceibacterota bacterium]